MDDLDLYKAERISVFGDTLSYAPDETGSLGMFIDDSILTPESNYFEIHIGKTGGIAVGLVSSRHPLDQYPGWVPNSIGYLSDGRLYKDTPKVIGFGPKFEVNDHIGCGLKFATYIQDKPVGYATVFFTKNRKVINTTICKMPAGGLHPAVGLHAIEADIFYAGKMKWTPEEEMSMCIDSNEEEWSRLHDIKLNGSILEYSGRGKSIIDVGLAQAKYPLDTTHHYFEIEILDPGENCYIAIGLARKDYPKYRHPGWNKGSIAYHADDGKIFVGSGVGDPFGPRCHKGDIMGCGIMFPRDFVCYYDCDESCENGPSSINLEFDDELSGSLSESEDEEWWKEKENVETGVAIQVFFTRNGKTIGQKDVCIPKGGFYPTIGMLSTSEKVKVDLHPLTG